VEQAEDIIDFSLIVEWENFHNTDESRSHDMLKILAQQAASKILEDHSNIELLVVFDPADTEKSIVTKIVNKYWGVLSDRLTCRVVPIPDSSYYVLKNRAALLSRGELIVFVDCDVLPQPAWLDNILLPFSDPMIGVSQGATYVEPHNLATLGLALAWVFPIKLGDGTLSESNNVFANNIAFRRSVFLEDPYPELSTWRGQCIAQREVLKNHGVGINWSENARTIHPFPAGFLAVVTRAFLNGHDHVIRYERAGGKKADWKASYRRFKSYKKRARKRRVKIRDELALSRSDEFLCMFIAAMYWGLALVSACMLHAFPDFWPGLFKDLPAKPTTEP
jgi:glycosyltransferase involved in cell wall biosynthesis